MPVAPPAPRPRRRRPTLPCMGAGCGLGAGSSAAGGSCGICDGKVGGGLMMCAHVSVHVVVRLLGFGWVRCHMNRSVPVPCTFRAHMPDPISAVTCCYPGTSCCSGCRPIDLSSGRATGASQWILYIRGKGGSVWGSGLVATCRAATSLASCSEPCREQASRGHPC